MAYSPYPGSSGFRTWHVVVFLGVVVIVADIVSIQMLGTKTNQFQFSRAPAPAPQPPVAAPPGTKSVTIPRNALQVPEGVVAGSRVNVLATLRLGETVKVFALLINVPVLAVDTQPAHAKDGASDTSTVSLALTEQQELALTRARQRQWGLKLVPRVPGESPKADKSYDISAVLALFQECRFKPLPVPDPPASEPQRPAIAPPPRPVREDR
jgi:hypothetical protein